MRGVHSQHAQIAALSAPFQVDRSQQATRAVLRHQDAALLHHGGQPLIVGARPFEKGLDGKCGINEPDQLRPVG